MQELVTIVLLAGGLATRLPGKLGLPVGNQPMLVRVYDRLVRATGCPCLISIHDELVPEIAAQLNAPVVKDPSTGAGPLAGLTAACARVTTPLLFAAAGDLPNLDAHALEALLQVYRAPSQGAVTSQAVVPRHASGQLEPLAALYATAALGVSAQRALAQNRFKVTSVLDELRVTYYDIPQVEESRYLNVNTAEDFNKLELI